MKLIEILSELIHKNVVFTVALAVIPLKLVMVRLCKDRDSEIDTVLAIPEDVSYVSAGLILSSVSSGTGPLQDYFRSTGSSYVPTDVAIVLLINCVVSIVVHKISQSLTKKQYMTWRAAVQEQENRPPIGGLQMELSLQGSASAAYDDNLSRIMVTSLVKMLFSLLLQFVLVGLWLYWIGAIYSSR